MTAPPAHGSRRRPGHQSCHACKAAKLRCVREQCDSPCERCRTTGQECRLPEKRPRKIRSGQRLELAKILYGDEQGPHETEAELSPTTFSLSLSEQSAESMMSAMEFRGQLSTQLMEEYFDVAHFPIPAISWRNIRAEFDSSGKRLERLLSPNTQVLAALLIAGGARVTSAPCVLGDGIAASDLSEGDLTYFGRRRQATCDTLLDRAVQLADQRGVFRHATTETVAILIMIAMQLDHGDPCRRKGRPYRVAAVAHARTIGEDCEPLKDWMDVVGTPLAWCLYVQDTWASASSAMTPTLGEVDDRLILPFVRAALPHVSELARALESEWDAWAPVGMVWAFLTRLMRDVNHHLRAGPVSVGIWSAIQDAYCELDDCDKCLEPILAIMSQAYVSDRPGYPLLRYYFAASSVPKALVTFYVHRALSCWSDSPSDFGICLPEALLMLLKFKEESQRRMAEDARVLSRMFNLMTTILPHRISLTLMPGMALLYETLPVWAEILCAIPTNEDGIVFTTYTQEEKAKEMRWFLNALHSLGWSYADKSLTDAIELLERCLEHAQ